VSEFPLSSSFFRFCIRLYCKGFSSTEENSKRLPVADSYSRIFLSASKKQQTDKIMGSLKECVDE
jgi:hypothetical protein